jgi:hypothetical protein
MLAGVMVLLAIVFLLGTGMALSVSTSLHQVDQGAAQDAARYGAESAVARGQAAVESGAMPTADGCSAESAVSSLNGQALQARPCFITGINAGAGIRYSSHAQSELAPGKCITVPLSSGSGGNGDNHGNGNDARAWTTVAWPSPSNSAADIRVFVNNDNDAACQTSGPDDDDFCQATSTAGPIYWHCAFHMDPGETYSVTVLNLGKKAYVSAFVVRDAASGHDCVATVIGKSAAATAEGDLILPGLPVDNPAACGPVGAHLGLRNRLLP